MARWDGGFRHVGGSFGGVNVGGIPDLRTYVRRSGSMLVGESERLFDRQLSGAAVWGEKLRQMGGF
jgi:hypothetical protein